ncbi:hypothetical protein ABFX02_05G097500 [Erythranthe guttata]
MSTGKGTHDCYEQYELKSYEKLFTCDGCKMKGFGQRYQCQLCGHELHKECRYPRTTTSHDYFPGSTFEFRDNPFTSFSYKNNRKEYSKICDACGKDICGFSYHCEADNLDLHPCCLNLKKDLTVDEAVFSLRAKVSSKCMWCRKRKISDGKRDVPGWSYVSACKKYHVHVYCMAEIVHAACVENGEMGLEKVDMRKLARVSGNRGSRSGGAVFGTVKSILKIILSALLGDPTMLISNVFVELVSRGFQ